MFEHGVDKSQIPVVNIMGVNIAVTDMNRLLDFTRKNIRELSGDYMCVSNVHTTVTAYDDPEYRKIQNSGIMAIPDGGPLSSVGRKRGCAMERTTGPSYMEEILKESAEHQWRHFFYGSVKETTDLMIRKIEEKYPGTAVAGVCNPPFRPLSEEEDREVTRIINESGADFVWIGLGAPKQEIWMYEHQGKIKGFMVGVGAAFDYLAGNISRAPEWMQKANLEWFYRLMQDPKRLFRRYFYTNTKFIWNAVIRGK